MSAIICRPAKDEKELSVCYLIRKRVFVEEQGLFKRTDRDRNDKQSIHIIALYNNKIVGTVRVSHKKENIWYGSRLAVLKGFRGRVGRQLILKAIDVVRENGGRNFYAKVQLKNVRFFKRLQWKAVGSAFSYRGVPHQLMEAPLAPD